MRKKKNLTKDLTNVGNELEIQNIDYHDNVWMLLRSDCYKYSLFRPFGGLRSRVS